MKKVFLSYSRTDARIANRITSTLKELNVSFFLDIKEIGIGTSVPSAVGSALQECQDVLVVLSPASLKSQWVPYEIGYAKALKKGILPFLTHKSLELPGFLAGTHYGTSQEEVRAYFEKLPPPVPEPDDQINLVDRYIKWWDRQNSIRKPSEVQVDGIKLLVPPGVFSPSVRLTYSAHMANKHMPDVKNKKVLDLGTGSGFLAISAAKRGAQSVTAVDVDDAAVQSAEYNVTTNKVESIVTVKKSDLFSSVEGKYDVILGNLPISAEATAWGYLTESVEEIIRRCTSGLHQHLGVGGVATLTWASFGPQSLIPQALESAGFRCRSFQEETFGVTWFVYEARRK